jgi:hypothetical protein
MRRATRTGSASWIARRRRVDGSILWVGVRGVLLLIRLVGFTYIVVAW